MANEEKKDELFSINLGEEMIEVTDSKSQEAVSVADLEKNNATKVVSESDVVLHDDGSFEIDEFAKFEDIEEQEGKVEEFIEKTEDKEKGKTPSKGGSSDSSPSSSPYLAFAKDRASEGVFLQFTDDDWKQLVEDNEGDEAQALREIHAMSVNTMIQRHVEKYKESLTPEERYLYEAKEKGAPVDKYAMAKKNLNKYSKLTADEVKENVSLQEDIISKSLEFRGFSPEEIQEEIAGYKALENLEAKALKALDTVPNFYKKEVETIEKDAENEENAKKDKIAQRVAKMKMLIDNTPEIIPGIKLTKPTRDKLVESMTVPVAQDQEGKPLNAVMATRSKNPEGFEMLIHYYHQLGLFNVDSEGRISPDFSKISKIETKKAVDSMRNVFEAKENLTAGKAAKVKTEDDDMSEFEKAFRRVGR